jgi:hypothetical protein
MFNVDRLAGRAGGLLNPRMSREDQIKGFYFLHSFRSFGTKSRIILEQDVSAKPGRILV